MKKQRIPAWFRWLKRAQTRKESPFPDTQPRNIANRARARDLRRAKNKMARASRKANQARARRINSREKVKRD